MDILRVCKYCGLEAYNDEDLEKFVSAKKYKYGKRNFCKECWAKAQRKGGEYYETKRKASLNWYYKNRDKQLKKNKKRITFKEDDIFIRIKLPENPRMGVCSECGSVGKTHIHHDKYDEQHPLKNTRELCSSCHARHHRIKDIESGEWNLDGWRDNKNNLKHLEDNLKHLENHSSLPSIIEAKK